MGATGFRALLTRALSMAQEEAPWLRVMQVKLDGSFEILDELATQDSGESAEGGLALVANFVGLLVAFIGEDLTLRLIREVWPNCPSKI
jgi:hypothetical protein